MERKRRSVEERIAEIDKKIDKYKNHITNLETRKEKVLSSNNSKEVSYKTVISKAKESGLKPEEVARLLGLEIE